MAKKNIDDLRAALFETLEGLRAGTIEIERARIINELGRTLCDTARVEVAYLETTGALACQFLASSAEDTKLPPGVAGITRHRIAG